MKKCLVIGAGGFIGSHLVRRLKSQGHKVTGVDLKLPEFSETAADHFFKVIPGDLGSGFSPASYFMDGIDEVYQLAADMGGAGFIFTGLNDANILANNASINIEAAKLCVKHRVKKVFFSSSGCVYPQEIQGGTDCKGLKESDAFPANPDSDYGWEKLCSEKLWQAFSRNKGLDVRIARFHNIYGEEGTFQGGREKAPAAICRKVALAKDGDDIEVWGDGLQTRSFLHIDDCLNGIHDLMGSDCQEPLNIGSGEQVSIDQMTRMVIEISCKPLGIRHVPGPQGVRGRNSDNTLVTAKTGWKPKMTLVDGLERTYRWINGQVGRGIT